MIRKAEINDAPSIQILMEQLMRTEFDQNQFLLRFKSAFMNSMYQCFVYENEGIVVGVITLLIKVPLHHKNNTAEILELCVHENYRNKKIGRALITFAEKYLVELGIEEVELCTHKNRTDAHRFYSRLDYKMDYYNYIKILK